MALVAPGLPLAPVQGLHNADAGVLIEIVLGKLVTVDGDNAGDDEEQAPEEDEEAGDQVQKDELSHEGKPVEQGQVLRPLAPADGHAVEGEARRQNGGQQGGENGDENAEKAAAAEGGDQVQNHHQGEVKGGHGLGGHLRGPEKFRRLLFAAGPVNLFIHHSGPPRG